MVRSNRKRMAFVAGSYRNIPRTYTEYEMSKVLTKINDEQINSKDIETIPEKLMGGMSSALIKKGLKLMVVPLVGDPIFNTMMEGLPIMTKFFVRGTDPMDPNGINSQVKLRVHTFHSTLGIPPTGKFEGNSYDHIEKTLAAIDTSNTYKAWQDRQFLKTNAGFNQKSIDFFDTMSFLTFKDIRLLTNSAEKVQQALTFRNKPLKSFEKGKNSKVIIKRNSNIGIVRAFSLINSISTSLIINNDANAYLTTVTVYLCTFRNYRHCADQKGTLTTTELVDNFLQDIDSPSRRSIRASEFIKREDLDKRTDPIRLKQTLIVRPRTNILRNQTIREHVQILNTYSFELKPSETGILNIDHFLKYGVDIFDIENYNKDSEACFNTFFICEAVGSPNAQIVEIGNPSNKFNGSSPTEIRYEFKLNITYNKKEGFEPDIHQYIEPDTQFEDYDLASQFAPDQGEKLTVNYEDISVNGNNPKAKYSLCPDENALITTITERVRESTNNNSITPEDARTIMKENKQKEEGDEEKETKNEKGGLFTGTGFFSNKKEPADIE